MNSQIANAAEQQRSVAEDIHRAVEHVSEAGRENADEAARASEAAVRLGDQIAELQTLVGRFTLSNAMLDFEKAKGAHLAWRARVRNYLDGKGSLHTREVVSHHDCVLGKWYYGEGRDKYGQLPAMRDIEVPHRRLHALIGEIVVLKQRRDNAAAEQLFSELDTLSTRIIGLLEQLEAKIDADHPAIAG